MLSEPTFDVLVAYVKGELDAEAAAIVEKRLAQTPDGAARLHRARLMLETARGDQSVAPPAETLAAAKAIFKAPAGAPSVLSEALDGLRRVLATLLFDSRVQPALVGFRGADDGFQVAFAAEGAEVELDFNPLTNDVSDAWQLMGQVTLPDAKPAAHVSLAKRGEAPSIEIDTDEHGVFSIPKLAPGAYDVAVRLSDNLLLIPTIEVP